MQTLNVILAFILVTVITALGTAAYLKKDTSPLKNTYSVGELFDKEAGSGFSLKEHKAIKQDDGSYLLSETEYTESAQKYDALPGVNIPKDPHVDVVGLRLPVYIFIEVVDTLDTGITYTIKSEWIELTDVEGPRGR